MHVLPATMPHTHFLLSSIVIWGEIHIYKSVRLQYSHNIFRALDRTYETHYLANVCASMDLLDLLENKQFLFLCWLLDMDIRDFWKDMNIFLFHFCFIHPEEETVTITQHLQYDYAKDYFEMKGNGLKVDVDHKNTFIVKQRFILCCREDLAL